MFFNIKGILDGKIWLKRGKKKVKTKEQEAERPEYVKHGFKSELKYRQWQEQRKQEKIAELLANSKKRNLKNAIQEIYYKRLQSDEVYDPILKEIDQAFKKSRHPKVLLETLLFLESHSKLLGELNYVRGIIAITDHYYRWIRLINEWKVKSHNTDRQFSSLVRHLLAKYDVPLFMDNAWFDGNTKHQEWFILIGYGKNIRKAKELPVPLTKMMAHHFLRAPAYYSIEGAFRWGQVHALNGDQRLADALMETRLAREFRDNDFDLSVIRFFVENPMLDTAHVGPIIDFIWNQKYENRRVFVARGVAEDMGPQQPNFSMKGRTVESLLNQVQEWHRQLGRETKGGRLQWEHSRFSDFEFLEGKKESKNMRFWYIRELLSAQELVAEGKTLHHCVASYAHSCYSGRFSIWTMELEDAAGLQKVLTIEVAMQSKRISQVRGKFNRLPSNKEKDVLKRWAMKEGLEIASYLR